MGSGMAEAYKPDTRSRLKPIEASRMVLGSSQQLTPVATTGNDGSPKDTLICRGGGEASCHDQEQRRFLSEP